MACGEDNNIPEEMHPTGLDFNLVTILEVTEPEADGERLITLSFKDKADNEMVISAISWHSYLETGWYEIGSDSGKFKACVPTLSVAGEPVKVTGGTMSVSKWNYEYDIFLK